MAYLMQHKARRLAFYNHSSQARSTSPDETPQEHVVSNNSNSSKRHIQRIDASAPAKLLITALEQDGCVIINDFTDASTLDAASSELKPWLLYAPSSEDEKDTTSEHDPNSHTLPNLLTHSPAVRETLFTTPLLQSLLTHFLTLRTKHYLSTTPITTTTPPLLSAATAITLDPGFAAQPLHRPDAAHHARHAKSFNYTVGRDVSLSIFIPTSDVGRSTAAPRVILGSHLWGDGQPRFNDEDGGGDVVSAEMEKGDVLVSLGSLYQGLGGFQTKKTKGGEMKTTTTKLQQAGGEEKSSKVVFVLSCVNGVTRPEDDGLMRVEEGVVKGWGEVVRERLGR